VHIGVCCTPAHGPSTERLMGAQLMIDKRR
jgi:hypothetical protein